MTATSLRNDLQSVIAGEAGRIDAGLIALRRDLHAHPELGFAETRTAGVVARELSRLGIPHETGVGGTGVVGTIAGGRPGPTLALRADMDALPIQEQTGLDFASTVPGLMHACGHDIHTSTLLGVAEVLARLAPRLRGTVKLLFQPAEEKGAGAVAMIADGAMQGVDFAIGFHNYPNRPVGRFSYCRGASLASVDSFTLTVHGRSGHAAHPDDAIDPIVAAAQLVGQLQTVVSREVNPIHPVVVTVGAIHGGTVNNIIPDSCTLLGTVRTLHAASRELAARAIGRLCAGMLEGLRVRVEVDYRRGVPPLLNDDGLVDRGVASVRAQLGDVVALGEPSLGGEDFALIAAMVPAFHLGIGSGAPGRADKLHNSGYQPDEACIGLGVQALSRAAADLLA